MLFQRIRMSALLLTTAWFYALGLSLLTTWVCQKFTEPTNDDSAYGEGYETLSDDESPSNDCGDEPNCKSIEITEPLYITSIASAHRENEVDHIMMRTPFVAPDFGYNKFHSNCGGVW